MSSRQTGEILAALIDAIEAIKKRLDDPRAEVREDIGTLVAEAIAKIEVPPGEPGKPGEPGRAPTAGEIQRAVDIWVELNRDSLRGPQGRPGLRGLQGIGTPGRAGRDATDAQVRAAVAQWATEHAEEMRGKPGEPGKPGEDGDDGVGIAKIEQRGSTTHFFVVLTDGTEYKLRLPQGQTTGGGVAIRSAGGGGSGQQEVFIDEQPALDYPAISFTGVVGYPGLYIESVNVP